MANKKDKEFREEIKAPDQFEDFWEAAGSWCNANRKAIFAVVIVGLIAALFWAFQKNQTEKANQKAMDAFVEVQSAYAGQDFAARTAALNTFIEAYGDTALSGLSYLYLGASHYQNKNWEKAKLAYTSAEKELSKEHKNIAIEALANIASEKGEVNKAKELYIKLVNLKSNPLKDFHMWNLIALQQQTGAMEEFKKNCDGFNETYKDSSYSEDVKAFCAAY